MYHNVAPGTYSLLYRRRIALSIFSADFSYTGETRRDIKPRFIVAQDSIAPLTAFARSPRELSGICPRAETLGNASRDAYLFNRPRIALRGARSIRKFHKRLDS